MVVSNSIIRQLITLLIIFILQVHIFATGTSPIARNTVYRYVHGPGYDCLYHFQHHCGACLRGNEDKSCRSVLHYGRSGSGDNLPFSDTNTYNLAYLNAPPGADLLRCSGFLWHLLHDRACTSDLSYAGLAAGGLAAAASRDFSPHGGIFSIGYGHSVLWCTPPCASSRRIVIHAPANVGVATSIMTKENVVGKWKRLLRGFHRCDANSLRVTKTGRGWKTMVRC